MTIAALTPAHLKQLKHTIRVIGNSQALKHTRAMPPLSPPLSTRAACISRCAADVVGSAQALVGPPEAPIAKPSRCGEKKYQGLYICESLCTSTIIVIAC